MLDGGPGVDLVVTERLTARRPTLADEDAYLAFFTDPRVEEEAWPAAMRTPEELTRLLDKDIAHWERWGFGPWTVELDGQVIGWGGVQHTTVEGRPEVELLWFLHPDHWGHGYATEIAREAVRLATDVLELDDVVAFTAVANTRSRALMERLGMAQEREFEHAGRPHVLYRLTLR